MIYKYLSHDAISVISQSTLIASRLSAFNDPFEGELKVAEETLAQLLARSYPKPRSTSDEAASHSTSWADIITAAANKPKSIEDQKADLLDRVRITKDVLLVMCFSRTYSDILMWSHYANAHKGFVVGFDESEWVDGGADSFFPFQAVEYAKERIELDVVEDYADDSYVPKLIRSYLRKSVEWEYEQEVRLLCVDKLYSGASNMSMHSKDRFLYQFNKHSIKEIIFGAKMEEHHKELIREAATRQNLLNIHFRQATLSANEYSLIFKDWPELQVNSLTQGLGSALAGLL